MGTTQITNEEFEKFQADAKLLYQRYSYTEMADLLKMGTGNLSSYCSGKKRPGKRFVFKFYELFKKDLAELEGKESDLAEVQDPRQSYVITRSKSLSPTDINQLLTRLDKVSSAISSLQKDVTLLIKLTKDSKTAGQIKYKKKPGG